MDDWCLQCLWNANAASGPDHCPACRDLDRHNEQIACLVQRVEDEKLRLLEAEFYNGVIRELFDPPLLRF